MKKRITFIACVVTLIVFVVTTGCQDKAIPSSLVGTWAGTANNTHVTPKNAPMPLTLIVSEDGSVTGTLGTASVKNGAIKRNRGKLGKRLNMKSDFLIYADLEGSLVSEKDIRYKGVFINMNIENGKVVAAGFSTTHSPHGTSITKQGLVMGRITISKKESSEQSAARAK